MLGNETAVRSIAAVICLMAAPGLVAQVPGQFTVEDPSQFAEDPIQIIGFGDLNYLTGDNQTTDGFTIGQAVAHIVAPIADRLTIFSEVSATARDSEYSLEIERLIARYDFNNRYTLSGGRYHSPIGYWNTAFHHGSWLQTSAGRPQMVKFGTPLIPIHFVGLLFEGDVPTDLGLSYSVGIGNGRHSNIARSGDAGDVNSSRAWSASLDYQLSSNSAVKAGIGFYSDRVNPSGGVEVDEDIFSAYFALERETPEIIVEYIHAEHDATMSSASGDMDSFYAQFAYRLSGDLQAFKPYVRIEEVDVEDNDPLLSGLGLDYEGAIVGVRYDFAPSASLKFEYHREEFGNMGRESNFQVQVNFVLARDR